MFSFIHRKYILWSLSCLIPLSFAVAYAGAADPCAGKEDKYYAPHRDLRSPGFGREMYTKHEPCVANHLKAFAGYQWFQCDLVVYLTDREREEEAKQFLTPFFKKNRRCRFRGKIQFKDAPYAYKDLEQMEGRAMELLSGVPNINMFSRWDGKINVFVEYDATIESVRQTFQENDLPLDAFHLHSREQELSGVKSIAPRVHPTEKGLEVYLPAVGFNNKVVGELVLGKSSMKEVEKTMPAWAGHGPSKIPKSQRGKYPEWACEQVIGVVKNMKYTFNPMGSMMITGFDKERRLTFAQFTVQQGQEKTLRAKLWELTDFSVVYSDTESLVHRAWIGDCVIVEATEGEPYWADTSVLTHVVYFYTCS
jgi:hypothetical protein